MTTGSLVFPTRAFGPTAVQVRLVGQAITGGVSLSGEAQFADISGGGRWVADFGEAALWTREAVLMWRRFVAAADGGAQALVVLLADRRHQPLIPKYTGADTFGLDTWVADVTAFTASEVIAPTTGTTALGATSLSLSAFTAAKPLLGGEHFSVYGATYGWRLYRVTRVTAGGLGTGDATAFQFRPPLREAIASGTDLNFESPRLHASVDGDLSETLTLLRFGKAQARFVEYSGSP